MFASGILRARNTPAMLTFHRRTERVTLCRNVHLLFRAPQSGLSVVEGQTSSVNCHGVGVGAGPQEAIPEGAKIYVFDRSANVGIWSSLKRKDAAPDGRLEMGLEFEQPGIYWPADPIPPSWKPFSFGPALAQA
jgi:hypothetical protein